MNVPTDYNDEAERLLNHPNLLPRVDVAPTLLENDKSILLKLQRKQKRASVYFAKDVSFENKYNTKDIRYTKIYLSHRVQKQTSTPIKHCKSVLDYCEYRQSAHYLKEISRANSVVRHRMQGQTKSARGLARDQPSSDDVARQWGIYQRYLRISSLPNH